MQYRTAVGINQELIRFYWSVGEDIVRLQTTAKYGDNFLYQLSKDLQSLFPDTKGFSYRNLHYMRKMYLTFSFADTNLPQVVAKSLGQSKPANLPQPVAESSAFTPQPVAQIDALPDTKPAVQTFTNPIDYISLVPWGHIRYILDKGFTPEKAFFYILKTIEFGWSRNMLLNMMSAELYEAEGKSINNFPATMPEPESDYANEIVKNPYHLDFLELSKNFKEKELQLGLEKNISRFLLELGDGFAYVGRQVRLEINGDEFFCDLLFYHLRLRRYIVVELKTGKFEPDFVSKLNLYCTAIDHLYRTDNDGETIGLLFCKEKNDLVAQWTVEKSEQPIAITRYELEKLMPKAKKTNKDI